MPHDNRLPATLLALTVISAADAERAGLDPRALRLALRRGDLVQVRRGWYCRPPGEHPDRLYQARCEAVRRSTGLPLDGISALTALGLPAYALDERPVFLAGDGATHRSRGDIRITHRLPGGAPLPRGAATVPLAEAVLSAALIDPELTLGAADAAARSGRLDVDALHAMLSRIDGRAGARQARRAVSLVDARRESVGESRTAWHCTVWGFELEPQFRIALGNSTAFADFRIKGTRVLLEFDGLAKYDNPGALAREKLREDELRRLGWTVVRITWADFYRPDELFRRIQSALAIAARAA